MALTRKGRPQGVKEKVTTPTDASELWGTILASLSRG